MGFKDALKKLGLGDINLLKVVIDNSKKIEIKDSTLVVDSKIGETHEYTLPNTVEYDDVKENIGGLYKKEISGFVRKDLVLPEVGMVSSREQHKEIFRFFKNTIKPEHYHALITAYAVMEFEDRGDSITSNELFEKMIKKPRDDARHIYNFARSGLIEGRFWHELGMIKFQGASKSRTYELFSSQFASYVNFYPFAIWVSPFMSFKDVIREVRIRINRKEISRLNIYLRGREKIDLLEDDLVELIDQKEGVSMEEISRYFIGNSPCVRITVVKDAKTFKIF